MRYTSFNDFCRNKFGCKVYKLSIDGGFTCPNRDGSLATGGCIFCSGGSGRFAVSGNNIKEQLEKAKAYVSAKGAQKYIAYFQSYTGTYAPVSKLEELYMAAISGDEIVALSVATRPDCLSEEVLALLAKINRIKPVFVELGLQTSNEKTAEFIGRGYENSVYIDAVKKLKANGINVITHLIFSLPNESEEDMLNSVKFSVSCGTDGVKFHMLNILEGSRLCEIYKKEPFYLLSREEYAELVAKAVSLLPENVVVHRLTGDGDKKILVAPEWIKDKKKTLNTINKAIVNC